MDDNHLFSENPGDAITTDKITNALYDDDDNNGNDELSELHVQLSRMVLEFNRDHNRGTVGTMIIRDIFQAMEQYERQHGLIVLTEDQKTMIRPYCDQNPNIELSGEDLERLVDIAVAASQQEHPNPSSATTQQPASSAVTSSDYDRHPHSRVNTGEMSPFSSRTRTGPLRRAPSNWRFRSPPTSPHLGDSEEDYPGSPASPCSGDDASSTYSPRGSTFSRRRQSVPSYGRTYDINGYESGGSSPSAAAHNRQLSRGLTEEYELSFEGIAGEENVPEVQVAAFAEFYDITTRLKNSERSLATVAQQHEMRIEALTGKVDELKKDLTMKKRELSEFKNKETNNLMQISALETNILHTQKSETDYKQTYITVKRQYDEKCEETSKLQEQLRYREDDMHQSEGQLAQLLEERDRLDAKRRDLESELAAARTNHIEFDRQRYENEHLRETIDRLRAELDARVRLRGLAEIAEKPLGIKTLHSELALHSEVTAGAFSEDVDPVAHLHAEVLNDKLREVEAEERVRTLEEEKNYYKQQADKAREELDQEKRSLESQIAELRSMIAESQKQIDPEKEYADAAIQVTNKLFEIGIQCGDGDTTTFEEISSDPADIQDAFETIHEDPLETPRVSVPNVHTTAEAGIQCRIDHGANKRLEEQYKVLNNELALQFAIVDGMIKNHEKTGSVSGKIRKPRNAKKTRTSFQDMNDLTDAMGNTTTALIPRRRPVSIPGTSMAIHVRGNDKIVTNAATFALYTVVVYLFGIVTSTFLTETGQATIQYGAWDQTAGGATKAKFFEVILYWAEKLLTDGELGVPS